MAEGTSSSNEQFANRITTRRHPFDVLLRSFLPSRLSDIPAIPARCFARRWHRGIVIRRWNRGRLESIDSPHRHNRVSVLSFSGFERGVILRETEREKKKRVWTIEVVSSRWFEVKEGYSWFFFFSRYFVCVELCLVNWRVVNGSLILEFGKMSLIDDS